MTGAVRAALQGVLITRRTEEAQSRVISQSVLESANQTRLPNTRLPRDQHDTAFARLDLLLTPQQQVDLFIATQRGQIPLAQRLEAALGGTRADHLPCRSRRGQA